MAVSDYSTTPSANTSISGLAVSDATPVDGVDNIIRQLMADVRAFYDAAQPLDTGLTEIAALTPTDGNFIVGNGTSWVAESAATARTSLGLGGLATLDILDEDDFVSDSATRPPSQQSTAVYVGNTIEGRLITGSRQNSSISFGTSRQNTQGKDIFASVTISSTATAALGLEMSADNATWFAVGRQNVTTPNQITFGTTVPKDFYYRVVTTAGTGVVNSSFEVY